MRTVLTVFAMRDFENCVDDGAFFNRILARLYVTYRLPGLPLYFVNFRPSTFAYDFNKIKEMRTHADAPYSMVMDRYGSSPYLVEPPEIREDMRVDPDCFPYLAAMEADLEARGIRWIVALMPAMPAWINHYDPGGERDADWRRAMKATLTSPNTVLIDGEEGPLRETHHFTDPSHLHWNNVPQFTRWIFAKVNGTLDDVLETGV
ncbi:MAG TPA: hypothetical protein VMP03_02190 [Methylomirabilota bacterium]|nr:hypothetical protein [Methylomirabilota bacterium]